MINVVNFFQNNKLCLKKKKEQQQQQQKTAYKGITGISPLFQKVAKKIKQNKINK